jgi:hypothetical protein
MTIRSATINDKIEIGPLQSRICCTYYSQLYGHW